MLFWKSLWKIQLPFSKITKGKGKYIYNPEMNIYSRSGIVKFQFFLTVNTKLKISSNFFSGSERQRWAVVG